LIKERLDGSSGDPADLGYQEDIDGDQVQQGVEQQQKTTIRRLLQLIVLVLQQEKGSLIQHQA
jgi:hypothetical protein